MAIDHFHSFLLPVYLIPACVLGSFRLVFTVSVGFARLCLQKASWYSPDPRPSLNELVGRD